MKSSAPLTEKRYVVPFILVTSLFFLWAIGVNINDILVQHLKKAFNLTDFQSSAVPMAFFGGYFLAALPAGWLMQRVGYKKGILIGLLTCASGAFLFIPAASIRLYAFFLFSLFLMACGQSFLEVAANPYTTVLGPPESSERRINFAQSFNAAGAVQWRKVWDGTGFPPLDQDSPVKILLDPTGNVLSCITGYTASGHPDYVVVKYAPSNGATLWEASWGVSGGDFPADMEIDAAGDVYVTGIGIDFIDKYSTIKLRGSDGQLLWQFYDALGQDHSASGLFLDSVGGVFITGASDPDGHDGNFNDDSFTVTG